MDIKVWNILITQRDDDSRHCQISSEVAEGQWVNDLRMGKARVPDMITADEGAL